jgi:hypothetical protein
MFSTKTLLALAGSHRITSSQISSIVEATLDGKPNSLPTPRGNCLRFAIDRGRTVISF